MILSDRPEWALIFFPFCNFSISFFKYNKSTFVEFKQVCPTDKLFFRLKALESLLFLTLACKTLQGGVVAPAQHSLCFQSTFHVSKRHNHLSHSTRVPSDGKILSQASFSKYHKQHQLWIKINGFCS